MRKTSISNEITNKKLNETSSSQVLGQVSEKPATPHAQEPSDGNDDVPFYSFPEWIDQEVSSEKWPAKHTFEDPDGLIRLPPSLLTSIVGFGTAVVEYKRPSDFIAAPDTPTIVQQSSLDEIIRTTAPRSQMANEVAGVDETTGSENPHPVRGTTPAAASRVGTANNTSTADAVTEKRPDSRPHTASSQRQLLKSAGDRPGTTKSVIATIAESSDAQVVSTSANSIDVDFRKIEEEPSSLPEASSFLSKEGSSQQEMLLEQESTMQVDWSRFSRLFRHNLNLIRSSFMRHLLQSLHIAYDFGRYLKSNGIVDDFMPWDHIYPKGKDGLPAYNSSGKYMVRLYWLGAWRKVVVDDRIPFINGQCLLLSSPVSNEIWPMILCKAILKIATYSMDFVHLDREYGDFDFLHCLSGWIPEGIQLKRTLSETALATLVDFDARNVDLSSLPIPNTPLGSKARAQTAPSSAKEVLVMIAMPHPILEEEITEACPYYALLPQTICEIKANAENQLEIKLRNFAKSNSFKSSQPDELSTASVIPEVATDEEFTILTYTEFVRLFKSITILQNPAQYRFQKNILHISDGTKPSDMYSNDSYILTVPDAFTETGIIISIASMGIARKNRSPAFRIFTEKYNWRGRELESKLVSRQTNGTSSFYVKLSPSTSYRLVTDSSHPYTIQLFGKDDFVLEEESKFISPTLQPAVKDIEELHAPLTAHGWMVLLKNTFKVTQSTVLIFQLYMSEALSPYSCIHIIDNDTKKEARQLFMQLKEHTFTPNEKGYTLLVDCRPPIAHPASKFKLRLFASPSLPEFGPDFSLKANVLDMEEQYICNRNFILFRNVLKVKDAPENCVSFHLSFSLAQAPILFQVFFNDQEIYSDTGIGSVTIPALSILKIDEPPPAKKNANTTNPLPPKPRYIIQASVAKDPSRYLKSSSTQSLVLGNNPPSDSSAPSTNQRPVSRGPPPAAAPKPGSAGKKTGIAKNASEPSSTISELQWKLRVISSGTANIHITKDTEKEDRYKAMKEAWDASAPGRLARAKELRESFLNRDPSAGISQIRAKLRAQKMMLNGSLLDPIFKLQNTDAPVPRQLRDTDNQLREEARSTRIAYFQNVIEEMRKYRTMEKESRGKLKEAQFKPIEELAKETEGYLKEDLARRVLYRKLVKETDELRQKKIAEIAAQEAALAAAMNAETVEVEDSKKKKGKK